MSKNNYISFNFNSTVFEQNFKTVNEIFVK